jgi:pimeloyl-ACP methyl ester carboxylesterase
MPVLLVNAAHDRLIPLRVARQIREHIPHARLVVIEDAAHLLVVEQPAACERAMRDFLSDSGVGREGREPAAAGSA